MASNSLTDLLSVLHDCRLLEAAQLDELASVLEAAAPEPQHLRQELNQRGWLTNFQIDKLLCGEGPQLALGQYVLLDLLGEGGMGLVYKARHRLMNRVVALKVIRPEQLASEGAVRRFQREIQASAQLSHPNVVIAHDADQVGNSHFFVMEYVEGVDLGKLGQQRGALPIGQACDCIRQAALGLQHAHEKGLVHRDIKPTNLLLMMHQGTVKVLDLGLARLRQENVEASEHLTRPGMVMGTPDYMAPEQGSNSHQVDIRADIYSLGCTLYYLLSGRVPFPDCSMVEKLVKHRMDEPFPVEALRPEVPTEVAAVLRRMMAKKPEDRYPTPGEAAAALAPLCEPVQPAAELLGAKPAIPSPAPQVDSWYSTAHRPASQPSAKQTGPVDPSAANVHHSGSWTPLVLNRKPEPRPGRPRRALAAALIALVGAALLGLGVAWLRPRAREDAVAPAQVAANSPPTAAQAAVAQKSRPTAPGTNPAPATRPADPPKPRPAPPSAVAKATPPPMPPSPPSPELTTPPTTPPPAEKVGLLGRLEGHIQPVKSVAFLPGRPEALSCGADYSMRLWNLDTLQETTGVKYDANIEDLIWSVAVSADGNRALTGCGGKLEDGKLRLSFDNVLLLWDVRTGRVLKVLKGHEDAVLSVALSSGGRFAVSGSVDRTVRGWDLDTGRERFRCAGHQQPVNAVALNRDGDLIASASRDRTVRLWDGRTGKHLRTLQGHQATVTGVAFSPDGRRLVSCSHDQTCRLWDVATGEEIGLFDGHTDAVGCVAFSPDGERVLSGGADHVVRLWDVRGCRQIEAFKGHQATVNCVAFSSDGQRALSGSDDQVLRLWALPKPSKP